MALAMKNYIPEDRIVCLAKGEPGCGKTVGISSFAKQGPMYIFNIDGKIQSIYKMYRNRPEVYNNIFHDRYDGFSDVLEKLEQIHDETRKANFKCMYKSLFVDSLTPFSRSIQNAAIDLRIENASAEDEKRYAKTPIVPSELQDFNLVSQGISNMLALLRSTVFEKANVNIFLTAHVIEVEYKDIRNKTTNISRSLITGGKKIAAEIPVYFPEQWHFDVEGMSANSRYTVVTQHGGEDFACSALPLPTKFEWTLTDDTSELLVDKVMKYIANPTLAQREKEGYSGPKTQFAQPQR